MPIQISYSCNIPHNISFFLQCISLCSFFGDLMNNDFLQSSTFKGYVCGGPFYKQVLVQSGIGNPPMMQAMLYLLLVAPREILSRSDYNQYKEIIEPVNQFICRFVEKDTISTYENEETKEKINYTWHIRNSIAHSRCDYKIIGSKNCVFFHDINTKQKDKPSCVIIIECGNIGLIIDALQASIITFINKQLEALPKTMHIDAS